MSNLTNLQRDNLWPNLAASGSVAFSSDRLLSVGDILVNAPVTVYDVVSAVKTTNTGTTAVAASSVKAVGCYIKQPGLDRTPYRVKAYSSANAQFAIVCGYGPASITGSDDQITPVTMIPFTREFDDVIVVPNLPEGDPLEDRAFCFGIAALGTVSASYLLGLLSVQRLANTPPTMATSVP